MTDTLQGGLELVPALSHKQHDAGSNPAPAIFDIKVVL